MHTLRPRGHYYFAACLTFACFLVESSIAQDPPTPVNVLRAEQPQVATPIEVAEDMTSEVAATIADEPPRDPSEDSSVSAAPIFWRPLIALGLGVFVVLALMIGLRTHAFIALILGALVISCFVPLDIIGFVKSPTPHVVLGNSEPVNIVKRVTSSLGNSVTDIGILIAMAAIIGKCMLVSGAADRIVNSALATFGEKRAAFAMMVSGFVLAVPVFFDTVFYLLVPLARSLYRRTHKNYLLYLGAIAAGGAITHTLVPPTPGPLLVSIALEADLGLVMMIGLLIGAPTAIVGLLVASWLNRTMPIEMRPLAGASEQVAENEEFSKLPSLGLALIPVLLPVVLITIKTVVDTLVDDASSASAKNLEQWLNLFGDANLAMVISALFAIFLCWSIQGHTLPRIAEHVEDALLSGGVIILITAAGGAFGGLLGMSQIHIVVESLFSSRGSGAVSSGLLVLLLAYVLASLLKVAQGSSTVAMIVTSSLVATIALPLQEKGELGFNVAYLVPTIGAGSLMGSWMNDSGFWVFARMGVLTEGETLRSWTVLLSLLSLTAFIITVIVATLLPLT
jgi:gluconate:H+ symporter, GntP family